MRGRSLSPLIVTVGGAQPRFVENADTRHTLTPQARAPRQARGDGTRGDVDRWVWNLYNSMTFAHWRLVTSAKKILAPWPTTMA
jgi:hypothetical protein